MTPKRWFIMLLCAVSVIAAAIAALNIVIDPFSVFGDRLMNWHSYGMTNNPKTAKLAYIDGRAGEFDAFIVGPSGASGFSPETLEKYTGLRWYNMFNYGADMEYTKRLAAYLIEEHQPEMLLLVVPVISASVYAAPVTDIIYNQPLTSLWRAPFLFADPQFSTDKVRNWFKRSYLQQPFDVFIAETGTYNKSRRDAEAIGSLEEYLAANPVFVDPHFWDIKLAFIEENAAAVEFVLETAERFGTEVIVTTTPMLAQELGRYDSDEIREFYAQIARASGGFWDFSFSAISGDARYFYDTTHFRNSVGGMMLARMFGDDSLFIPGDLGVWVTPDNAAETAEAFSMLAPPENQNSAYERKIPILMYHDLTEEEGSVSPALFAEHMNALYNAGYTAVALTALKDYVLRGTELPERAVVITFDDGYLSNYTHGFPILRQYDFNAAIFAMGVSFGRDTHLASGKPIRPRFGEREARTMVESGLISIQSHTYDMHQVEGFDINPRTGILRMDGESEADYVYALRRDHALFAELIENATGEEVFALAYPFGFYDTLSAAVLRELGITMTFSTVHDHATLVKGLPQSLLEMNRFGIYGDMTGDRLVQMISPVSFSADMCYTARHD
ncbi:MAG: polysaccharide deacetylase family protein [Defluviitaleaceae bacterium]|nr:polysaccharide deacetylase family protein [Defluviitaleaceae bacterium]